VDGFIYNGGKIMKNVIWLDIETTGLDERHHSLLSVAAIRFDDRWENRREFYGIIHHPDPNNLLWSPAALDMHRKSGLIDRVKQLNPNGNPAVTPLDEVDISLMLWGITPQRMMLAGNSIHFDRRFINRYLPKFSSILHYRMIDVSGICEALRIFGGIQIPKIDFAHEAMSDANNSINLLQSCMKYVKIS